MPVLPPSPGRREGHLVVSSSCTSTCKACHCLCCLVFEGIHSIKTYHTLREEVNLPRFDGQTPIMVAANLGKVDVVQLLLESGANVNITVLGKGSALSQAVSRGHTEVVRLLLAAGADMNFNNGKVTVLQDASSKGHCQIIRELYRAGANLNTRNGAGGTAVHYAIQQKRPEALKTLIELGADLRICAEVSRFSGLGITPLNLASMNGPALLRVLLEEGGLSPNEEPSSGGGTPLVLAVYSGDLETVGLLLEKGADVNKQTIILSIDESGKEELATHWPVAVAAEVGNLAIMRALVDKGASLDNRDAHVMNSILHKAAVSGHSELVQFLVERGVAVNQTFEKGDTVLHILAGSGKLEMAQLLLELGGDANIQNASGYTPMETAAQEGKTEVVLAFIRHGGLRAGAIQSALEQAICCGHPHLVKDLLLNGADPNVGSALPPIYSAVSSSDDKAREIVRILVANGAKLEVAMPLNPDLAQAVENLPLLSFHQDTDNCQDVELYVYKNHISPLHVASGRGAKKVAKLLIQLGLDIDIRDKLGATPLHMACCQNQEAMALALIKWGANVDLTTCEDLETALHLSSMNGLTATVVELAKRGANLAIRTKANKTALMLALEKGHTKTANKLIELSSK